MRILQKHFLTLALIAAASACKPGVTDPLPVGNSVLFVGNSLTYVNDLPEVFRAVASTSGDFFNVKSHTFPDHALIDYLLDNSLAPVIARGGFKYIVMQQGPTTLPICRDTLIIASKQIRELARKVGAQTVSMMAWPTQLRQFDFAKVHLSALMAAQESGSIFAPVGDAWQLTIAADATIAVYGPDGYHPGELGTFLAALVLYEQLTGKDARNLPTSNPVPGSAFSMSELTVAVLQNMAHAANQSARGETAPPWQQVNPPPPPIIC